MIIYIKSVGLIMCLDIMVLGKVTLVMVFSMQGGSLLIHTGLSKDVNRMGSFQFHGTLKNHASKHDFNKYHIKTNLIS